MLKAAQLHFDNGEYVFINIDLFSTCVSLVFFFFFSFILVIAGALFPPPPPSRGHC